MLKAPAPEESQQPQYEVLLLRSTSEAERPYREVYLLPSRAGAVRLSFDTTNPPTDGSSAWKPQVIALDLWDGGWQPVGDIEVADGDVDRGRREALSVADQMVSHIMGLQPIDLRS